MIMLGAELCHRQRPRSSHHETSSESVEHIMHGVEMNMLAPVCNNI